MFSVVVFAGVFAPWLATHDPRAVNFAERFQAPSYNHLFGTDEVGFDVYSRVLYGARYDLYVSLIVLLIATGLGSVLGVIAGYFRGRIDELIMRVADVFLTMPGLILAMGVAAAAGVRTLELLVLAVAIREWAVYTRLVEGIVLSLRERGFIEAAHAIGASKWRIIFKHLLPNSLSPIIVQATLNVGSIVLTAASLSFLGFGAPPGEPEWGRMVSDGRAYIQDYPWIILFPGLAIFTTVLGLNLLGDGLRDILDPFRKRR